MNPLLKKALPHIIAIGVFLIVSLIFCKPTLEGKVLQQHDIVGAQGMAQNALEYKARFGHLPLWNTNIFSGMPNYQVSVEGPVSLTDYAWFRNFLLPKPIAFFFVASVCFYILLMALGLHPFIGIFGALSFAFSTYNPVIISAGHDTKMMAIAYAPALMAGLIWIYHRRYWTGLAVTALFATLEITANHPQINYYFFICLAFMSISYAIIWIRRKEWKHLAIAFSLALIGGLIGIGNAAVTFLTTSDYAKYTMRGGKQIETNAEGKLVEKKTAGLDPDYAFSYSLGRAEALTMLMPNIFGGGGSSTYADSKAVKEALAEKNIPEENAASLPSYWGGIELGTAGPPYIGAISCLLFVIGLFVVRTHHRWWILAAVLLSIMMAWGKYFEGFNNILLHNLPFYNKFRAPSMSLVIAQWLVPLLASLSLHEILFTERQPAEEKKESKWVLYAVGGLLALVGLICLAMSYTSPVDESFLAQYGPEQGSMIVGILKEGRPELVSGSFMRLVLFSLLLLALLFAWRKKWISSVALMVIVALVSTIDLFSVGKKYLGDEAYVDGDSYEQFNFQATGPDQQILNDKDPHFRVYTLTQDRFSSSPTTARTMYYHRSVGGYHPAKLRLYQDLIENQLSKPTLNMSVLNMLDTRYLLFAQTAGQDVTNVQRNEGALGAGWFVKTLQPVDGPVAEMNALDSFDARNIAFYDRRTENIPAINGDSSGTVRLDHYNNDTIEYTVQTPVNGFAVFSEIYYPSGWNAYLDGKLVPHHKVNYLLRGLSIPAGQHKVVFRFEPASYRTGTTLKLWSSILLYLCLAIGLFMVFRNSPEEREIKKA